MEAWKHGSMEKAWVQSCRVPEQQSPWLPATTQTQVHYSSKGQKGTRSPVKQGGTAPLQSIRTQVQQNKRAAERQSGRAANFQSTKGAEHHNKKSTCLESTTVQVNQSTWSTQCRALEPHSTRISGTQTNGEAKQQSITSSKQQKMKSSAPKHDSTIEADQQQRVRETAQAVSVRGGDKEGKQLSDGEMKQWSNGET